MAAAFLAPSVAAAPATAPRVVVVSVGPAGRATGFVVGDGRVMTVAHVLARRGAAITVGGRPATVVRRDDRLDLALLAVPGIEGARPRPATPAAAVTVRGRPAQVVRRADARIDGSAWRRPVLELRADVRVGDSGAPVLSATGRPVGIVFARSRARDGVAWAVDLAAPAATRSASFGR